MNKVSARHLAFLVGGVVSLLLTIVLGYYANLARHEVAGATDKDAAQRKFYGLVTATLVFAALLLAAVIYFVHQAVTKKSGMGAEFRGITTPDSLSSL